MHARSALLEVIANLDGNTASATTRFAKDEMRSINLNSAVESLQVLRALLNNADMHALEHFSGLTSVFQNLPDTDFAALECAIQNLEFELAHTEVLRLIEQLEPSR
jgi:hypothetical protein